MNRFLRQASPFVSTAIAIFILMLVPWAAIQAFPILLDLAIQASVPYFWAEVLAFVGAIWQSVVIVVVAKDLIRSEL